MFNGRDRGLTNEAASRHQRAERYTIDAVANALAILGTIVGRDSLGLGEAAEVAGVSKSTAYRLLATLEGAGLVERLPEGGYRPGIEAVRWASRLLDRLDVRRVASPLLQRLRDDVKETVNLAILREGSLVYVDILESPSPFRMADSVGVIAPIHATALGKAVAVHLDPARLSAILGPEPYRALTAKTPTTWPELNRRIDQARRDGFATDLEEVEIGVACVAAPVLVRGVPIGAISVSAPRARMTDQRMTEVGHEVIKFAHEVGERL
jgi:IclR family acetate operon transcriptional repressor